MAVRLRLAGLYPGVRVVGTDVSSDRKESMTCDEQLLRLVPWPIIAFAVVGVVWSTLKAVMLVDRVVRQRNPYWKQTVSVMDDDDES